MRIVPFILFAVLAIGILFYTPIVHFSTMTCTNIEVINKERVDNRYLIFSKGETFENVDSWLSLKFNSSDIYGQLIAGNQYSVKVTGFRLPIFSKYRNIIGIGCNG